MRKTPIERMLLMSNKTSNGCWVFNGSLDKDGYGRIGKGTNKHDGRKSFYILVHRLSYEHFNGPIPEGKLVCHTCDNPPCCNPSHLFIGTNMENMHDRDQKGRGADITGVKNPMCKLTDEQVQAIHRQFADGKSMTDIALEFGVIFQNISLIVRGINRIKSYVSFHGKQPPEYNPKPRLTAEQVSWIQTSPLSGLLLAKQFNISRAQVSRIKNGKRSGSSLTPKLK